MRGLGKLHLGLARGSVRLVPHDPLWAEGFARLAGELQAKVPTLELHHVGSTAVPGIPAKPILDLLGLVPSIEVFDRERERIEALGFQWKGDYGIPGRRYSVLYNTGRSVAYAHLHVFERGCAEAEAHLLFRDYLRAHPSRARAYAALKERLAADPALGRDGYTEAKAGLISELLAEARAWRSS